MIRTPFVRTGIPGGSSPLFRPAIYLLLTLAFYAALSAADRIWEIPHPHLFVIRLRRFTDAMLLALPVWFLHKKRWVLLWIALADLYLLSNVWYYRNYGNVMPLPSYLMVRNLDGLGPSIRSSIRLRDLWIVLPSVCFAVCYPFLSRYDSKGGGKRFRIVWCTGCLLFIAAVVALPYRHDRNSFSHPWPCFRNELMVGYREFGLINYWIYEIGCLQGCSDEEKQYAAQFVEASERRAFRDPLAPEHRKNLIVVLMESLSSWPIGLTVEGTEVTPFLDSLARDTSVICFPHVLPQVKDGRSSDAQLLLNTGLLPIETGAAASLYGSTNTYPSLPKALARKGYASASFICDSRSYWNQEATTKSYGFGALHEKLGEGGPSVRADENLYRRALPILRELPQPFYAQLVTMSGHDAVKSELESPLNEACITDEQAKYYLVVTQYADRCLAGFIDSLKRCGLYERSIVVITGDHDSITRNRYEGRERCELSDRFVPLFILNTPLKAVGTDAAIAQCDIYPSLLDMMNAGDYTFHGLGESVFRRRIDCASDHSSGWVGDNTDDSVRQYRKALWRVSDILIRSDYFKSRTDD